MKKALLYYIIFFVFFVVKTKLVGQEVYEMSLPGDVTNTELGMATYSIPIDVVPGSCGIQPNLSVNYIGGSNRSLLGVGFHINGMSSISRVGRTLYHDGRITSVDLNDNECFSLDGQRLIRITPGNVVTTQVLYGTEIENFARITKHIVSGGPFFEVVDDAGNVLEYGASDNARQTVEGGVLAWMLNKITDCNGNYMTITYEKDKGNIWPVTIEYTGNEITKLEPYASVCFEYFTDANEKNEQYIAGEKVVQQKLLKKIIVKYGNSEVRHYDFQYDMGRNARLISVELFDHSGEKLTKTSFKWGKDKESFELRQYPEFKDWTAIAGNFTNDNCLDLLLCRSLPSGGYKWQMESGNGDGTFNKMDTFSLKCLPYPIPANYNYSDMDELLYLVRKGTDKYEYHTRNFVTGRDIVVADNKETFNFRCGDLLGNLKKQLVFITTKKKKMIITTNVSGNQEIIVPKNSSILLADFNGNGKEELHIISYKSTQLIVYEYNEQLATFNIVSTVSLPGRCFKSHYCDLNGDGNMDILCFTAQGWYLGVSTGKTYIFKKTNIFNASGVGSEPTYPLMVADLNGDGKDDIVQTTTNFNNGQSIFDIYYSKGVFDTTFQYSKKSFSTPLIPSSSVSNFLFANIISNGCVDMFYMGPVSQESVLIAVNEQRQHDVVELITNGLGKTTLIEYQYFNSPTVGYIGMDGKKVQYPLVFRITNPDGIGGSSVTVFSNSHAVFDAQRRKFMGFLKQTTVSHGMCNEIYKEQDFEHNHLFVKSMVSTIATAKDSTITRCYVGNDSICTRSNPGIKKTFVTKYKDMGGKRFLPYTQTASDYNELENSQKMTQISLYESGRVKTSTITYKTDKGQRVLAKDSTLYEYINIKLPNGKFAVQPYSITTWNELVNSKLYPFHQTMYRYTGGRLYSISESDSNGGINTTYLSYNNMGIVIKKELSPFGMENISQIYDYDSTGRFVTKYTNALGHTEKSSFDAKTAQKLSETDCNELTTTFKYDKYGRLIKLTRPDGTSKTLTYNRVTDQILQNAVSAVTESENGLPDCTKWFDVYGRTIRTYIAGQGYHDIKYDDKGNIISKTSTPFGNVNMSDDKKIWHRYEYDNFNRVLRETAPYTDICYTYPTFDGFGDSPNTKSIYDNIRDISTSKTYDCAGRIIRSQDSGGEITYEYDFCEYDDGSETSITANRNTINVNTADGKTAQYVAISDLRGNRLSFEDPDAGRTISTYNTLNQLVSQTNAKGNTIEYVYDLMGRVTREGYYPKWYADYTYDNGNCAVGKLTDVKFNGRKESHMEYDNLSRLVKRHVYDISLKYTYQYEYDDLGRIEYLTYPDKFKIKNSYNEYSELIKIEKVADNSLIYVVDGKNKFRQPAQVRYGNGTGTEYSYNKYGQITRMRSGKTYSNTGTGVMPSGGMEAIKGLDINYHNGLNIGSDLRDLTYDYDYHGFIIQCADAKSGQMETYQYDELDRLVCYQVNDDFDHSFNYTASGNINRTYKGSYKYNSERPHAVTGVLSSGNFNGSKCDVEYDMRDMPIYVSENGYSITIDYFSDKQRKHTYHRNGQNLIWSKLATSKLHEFVVDGNGKKYHIDYIYAEGTPVAVNVRKSNIDSIFYVFSDRLGSWNIVTDSDCNIVQQSHFSPWGVRMENDNWMEQQEQKRFRFDRGFTGHEHYDRLKIINTNARLYDPEIGRFFSPDPFVQMPDFTQSYNRYSYCLNNPIMYKDPTGNVFVVDDLILAAGIGAICNAFAQIVAGNVNNAGDFFIAAGIGAAAGAVGYAAGSGVNAVLAGGNFISGFIGTSNISSTGFIAGVTSGAVSGFTNNFIIGTGNSIYEGNDFEQSVKDGWNNGIIGLAIGGFVGGVSGGVNAVSNNRNFWTGNAQQYDISYVDYACINGGLFETSDDYTVINNSDHLAFFKPEDGTYGVGECVIYPHKGIKVKIDGLATYKYLDKVYKVPGKGFFTPKPFIAYDGDVYFPDYFDNFALKLLSLSNYKFGWMTLEQLDSTWQNLFNSIPLIK